MAGLRDRSARPLQGPSRLPPGTTAQIEALRRLGLNRLKAPDPKPEIIRYDREHPGELIHIDIRKLGRIDGVGHRISGNRTGQGNKRGTGWEDLHVAIGDASRLAFIARCPTRRRRAPWSSAMPPSPGSRPMASRSSGA